MQVTEVAVKDIKVRFRLRTPSDEKVKELAESIEQVDLINPITLDQDHNLIAGFHRLLAFRDVLKRDTIPAIVKEADKRFAELLECDENLKRNELNWLEISSHIVRREELLKELGLTYLSGDNAHSISEEKYSVKELAAGIGLSSRSYQQRKQIDKIHPEVKDLLTETEFAKLIC